MGGCGSGTWYRWDKKITLEGHKRLDIRDLCRRKLLYPGYSFSWQWSIDGKPSGDIRVEIKRDHLFLIYRYRDGGKEWQDVEERVYLDWTRCNYGGQRPWFLCPGCGRRVGLLAAAGKLFLCRHCYHLSYSSQNETELDRMNGKKQKIRARLGAKEWLKPKGMHQKTFERLHSRLVDAEMLADELFNMGLATLLERERRRTKGY